MHVLQSKLTKTNPPKNSNRGACPAQVGPGSTFAWNHLYSWGPLLVDYQNFTDLFGHNLVSYWFTIHSWNFTIVNILLFGGKFMGKRDPQNPRRLIPNEKNDNYTVFILNQTEFHYNLYLCTSNKFVVQTQANCILVYLINKPNNYIYMWKYSVRDKTPYSFIHWL